MSVLRAARQAIDRLVIFQGVLDDPIGRAGQAVLDQAIGRGATAAGMIGAYNRLFMLLAEATELGHGPLVGDPWQDYLLGRILTDENVFSRKAQRGGPLGAALRNAVGRDLKGLHDLFLLDGQVMAAALTALAPDEIGDALLPWTTLQPMADDRPAAEVAARRWLAEAADWSLLVAPLADHYAHAGTGLFARYRAFRWQRGESGGQLVGVEWPDPIRLEQLIGYEAERQPLLANTEQFLAGFRANNVLLYGDRGTGKSSTIKALLNEYAERGLRLIEVPRRAIDDLPAVMRQLRGRPERFIVFIDDLAFAEVEERHLDLKVLLEGGLEHHPDNVVVYVTSNRRHLLREYFTPDRGLIDAGGEIRPGETVQELLSLADRFGLAITFLAPTQERYLAIVSGLAEQQGLSLPVERLRQQALQWSTRHNGLSGRTARQFIDHLTGEIGRAMTETGHSDILTRR